MQFFGRYFMTSYRERGLIFTSIVSASDLSSHSKTFYMQPVQDLSVLFKLISEMIPISKLIMFVNCCYIKRT